MKSKGFTLIELMATILIIAAIALLSFPVLTNVVQKNKEIEEETFKESAIAAAKTYFNINKNTIGFDDYGYKRVPIVDLISQQILEKPSVKYPYNNYLIQCNKDYKCKFQKIEYIIGDKISVNGEEYYVIADSKKSQDYVVALKENVLTASEINLYGGVGTDHNVVNTYQYPGTRYINTSYNSNYPTRSGGMVYYSNADCGYTEEHGYIKTGCTGDYSFSNVKIVVDAWAEDKFKNNELKEVDGYMARLITVEELNNNLGITTSSYNPTYSWVYKKIPKYWTMSEINNDRVIIVYGSSLSDGEINYNYSPAVRPVINVNKWAID